VKKLITSADVKSLLSSGQKTIQVEPRTIITPAARDMASESGVSFQTGPPIEVNKQAGAAAMAQAGAKEPISATGNDPAAKLNEISPELIAKIVKEVVASMPGLVQTREPEMIKEEDPSGVRLVRGETVNCDPFNTGNSRDKVGIKEILTTKESPNMCPGFMTVEDSAFSWDLTYDEVDYVIEGTLDIIVNGKTYRGTAGDVFYIPRNTTVTFSSPDKAKFFFVTYPANWAELSNYQK